MIEKANIRKGSSFSKDARQAISEFYSQVFQPDMSLVLFFCSNEYDLEIMAAEIKNVFGKTNVVGCTTAGEIGLAGYSEHSISGASFASSDFTAVSACLEGLSQIDNKKIQVFSQKLLQEIESQNPTINQRNSFAFLLIDGMSTQEEAVTRLLQAQLKEIQIVGGSAGDGLDFKRTHVYFNGKFHNDSVVLTLITTPLAFKIFKTQHFMATDERLVVTDADPVNRIVKEINGFPAAEEYARVLGIDLLDLDPMRFAACPFVVMIDGSYYVRAIQKANPDGSLTFFCAIDNGLVLRVAKGVNFLDNLKNTFAEIKKEIGEPQIVLCCDCLHRKLSIECDEKKNVSRTLVENNAIGFNTYGEQYRGIHVNQTLVGVAIGEEKDER